MKKIFIALALAPLFFASCKKALEEKPYSVLTPVNFYKTAADAQLAINGVLSQLQPQAYYQRTIYLITELTGDGLVPLLTQNQERIDLYKLQYTASNIEIQNWWQNSYKLISRANDVIANVPGIAMDDAPKNNIIGNAMFLRAMAYFDLVRSFGDVPIVLKSIQSLEDPNLYPDKSPAAKVYEQIISDLKFAEANCYAENKISIKGMVSTGAASAMLARVYLQRSSTTFADVNDGQNALASCNKVINSGIYKLMTNYSDVFNCDLKYFPTQTEHIFDVQFGDDNSTTQNIIIRMFSPAIVKGSGSFVANLNLFNNTYTKDDVIRKSWNVSNTAANTTVTPYVSKFKDPKWVAGTNNSRVNWIVLRYADVLMMQSEAMNKVNPADPAKFNGLNAVRARAGLTLPTQQLSLANTPTSAAFVDSLVKDRSRELCIEGHRRWDLIRLGKYKEVEKAVNNVTVQDFQLLFPIPSSELDANKKLKQNTGY